MARAYGVRNPESDCVECGCRLPAGTIECRACTRSSRSVSPAPDFAKVEVHLRRSRARLLVGLLWFVPVLPLAFLSARAASRHYLERRLDDVALRHRIERHTVFAVAAVLVWLVVAALWISG